MAFDPETLDNLNNFNQEVFFNEKVTFFDDVNLGGVTKFTGTANFNNVNITGSADITDLTVNSIYANVYKNFKFSALPNTTTLEPTYGPNRILRVKSDGTGYELVDSNIVISSNLTSYGLSGDGNVHDGLGENENSKFKISGISTGRFLVGEKIKIFGVTPTSDSSTVDDIVVASSSITKVGTAATVRRYRYWMRSSDCHSVMKSDANCSVEVMNPFSMAIPISMLVKDFAVDHDVIRLALSRVP